MAFDPDADDPDLLRTVVMLLRTMAVAAVTACTSTATTSEARRSSGMPAPATSSS